MIPTTKDLENLLHATCGLADEVRRAYCENYLYEERVSRSRQTAYEAALGSSAADFDAWDEWHRDRYLWSAMHRPVPETFTAANAAAAHSGELVGDQDLVRVESLEYALGEMGHELDQLVEYLDLIAGGGATAKYGAEDAQDALASICASLNRNPFGIRPRFAGFLEDVEGTLAESDWPDRVRDRFGLSHYNPRSGEAIPVALMRYRVQEVLDAAAGKTGAEHPVCVPTVLDHEFTACFVPSPRELPYGRTLQLGGDAECERKIAEVLHLRLAYEPRHVYKVGAVARPIAGLVDPGLAALRDEHFFCLAYDSDRSDFGAPPPGWPSP